MTSKRAWTLAVLAAAGGSALACSALLGLDDVTFDARDAQAADDAGIDAAGRGDADASTETDASAAFKCTGAEHWICDTFDRGGAVDDPAYWTIPLVTGGSDAAVSIEPGPSLSPPNALRIVVNDSSFARLASSTFGTPATGVRCQLGLYVESRCTQNPATVFELTMKESTVTYTLILVLHKASDAIDQWQEFVDVGGNVDGGTGNFPDELPRGKFTRIALDVSAASLAISFDGQPEANAHKVTLPPVTFTTTRVAIEVNPFSTEPGCAVRFDDVVCDRY